MSEELLINVNDFETRVALAVVAPEEDLEVASDRLRDQLGLLELVDVDVQAAVLVPLLGEQLGGQEVRRNVGRAVDELVRTADLVEEGVAGHRVELREPGVLEIAG